MVPALGGSHDEDAHGHAANARKLRRNFTWPGASMKLSSAPDGNVVWANPRSMSEAATLLPPESVPGSVPVSASTTTTCRDRHGRWRQPSRHAGPRQSDRRAGTPNAGRAACGHSAQPADHGGVVIPQRTEVVTVEFDAVRGHRDAGRRTRSGERVHRRGSDSRMHVDDGADDLLGTSRRRSQPVRRPWPRSGRQHSHIEVGKRVSCSAARTKPGRSAERADVAGTPQRDRHGRR